MTVAKVTVSLDPAVVDRAKRDVAEGRTGSVSAWLNDAAKAHIEREDLEDVLAELLDETGGPPTLGEINEATNRLSDGEHR